MALVSGEVAHGFEEVRQAFEELHAAGWEVGSSFTAHWRGRRVVHLNGGVRDPSTGEPYDDSTLQLVASSTKVLESLGVALLVDRGLIEYGAPIAAYWPSFAKHGKGHITVRQLMMHRAGLAAPSRPFTDDELFDAQRMESFLESQAPQYEAVEGKGNKQGYHAVTRGIYASALCRRVDPQHRSLASLVLEELCTPLGVEFYIGCSAKHAPRVSKVFAIPPALLMKTLGLADSLPDDVPPPPPHDPRFALTDYERAFMLQLLTPKSDISNALFAISLHGVPPHELANSAKLRECELPSSNGYTNSHSMSVIGMLCAQNGVVDGAQYFRQGAALFDRIEELADSYSPDLFMGTEVKFTQGGFAKFSAFDDDKTTVYGWGGAGGTMVRYSRELQFSCGYATNKLGIRMAMNDPRPIRLLTATLNCIKKLL